MADDTTTPDAPDETPKKTAKAAKTIKVTHPSGGTMRVPAALKTFVADLGYDTSH